MAASYDYSISSPSMKCELKVIGAKNIKTKQKGNLFIRCYLSGGSNSSRRIQINTKEVSSSQKDDYIFWDESFSLECNGTGDSIRSLEEESVFLELRWRNKKAFMGKIGGCSKVLATAEMPWKNVFGATKMELQSWVVMNVVNNEEIKKLLKLEEEDGVKPPALQIAMKVEVPMMSMEEMRMKRRRERLDECGCKLAGSGGCSSSCVDNELLLIGAILDGF